MSGTALKRVCDDLAALDHHWGLPRLALVHVRFRAVASWSDDEVEAGIAPYQTNWHGWMRRQSGVALCPAAGLNASIDGAPLAGEWVKEPDGILSAHLRYGGGRWTMIEIEESPQAADGARPVLKQKTSLLGTEPAPRNRLHYAVYWGDDGNNGAIRRVATRFLGFS